MTNANDPSNPLQAKIQELEAQLQLRDEEVELLNRRTVMLEEQLAQATFDAVMDVWEYDIQNNSFRSSGRLSDQLQLDAEAYENPALWSRIIPEEDLAEANRLMQACITGESSELRLEHRLTDLDGGTHWILVCGHLVTDATGVPVRIIGTSTDISERKQLRTDLIETQNRFKLFAQVTRDAVYDCDFTTGTVWRNRAYSVLFGVLENTGEDIQWWKDHIHPEDRERVLSTFETCLLRKGSSWSAEYRFQKADGSFAQVIDRGYLFYDKDGAALRMIGAATDVSALKTAEYERSQMERKLLETHKYESIGVLSSGIAHKFNNLLTPILGSSSHLLNILPVDSQHFPLVEVIHNSSKTAAELVEQLLSYTGKTKLSVTALDLSQAIGEMHSLFRAVIPPTVSFSMDLADSLPQIDGDHEQLRQLVMILLTNAAESLEDKPGEVVLRTGQMHVDAPFLQSCYLSKDLAPGHYLFVEVEDTGEGIPESYQDKIFDPFFSTKFFGRGLGLATALGILRGHKGAICVTSEPNKGTRFRAIFPVAVAQVIVPYSGHKQDSTRSAFLVVEDEDWVREMVQHILEAEGHRVYLAADGEEGLEMFHNNAGEINCVILDVAMPKKNGLEVLREMRTHQETLPVIIISGFAETEIVQQIKAYSNVKYLHKPFTVGEFLASL